MSELPTGWVEAPLEDLCLSVSDGDHQAPAKAASGIPFITISAIGNGKINLADVSRFVPAAYQQSLDQNRKPKKGDILLSVTGSIGRAAIVDDPNFVFQRHIALIRSNWVTDRKYIYYFLLNPDTQYQLKESATGTAQKTLPLTKLRSVKTPLPPLTEQKRIVAKLDALGARSSRVRKELERIDALVARYKQAVLSKAFSGELTKDWREDGAQWPRPVRLDSVATSFSYGSSAKSAKTGEIPVLRMGNIQSGKLDWADLVFTDDEEEIAKYALRVGDVLFNRTNSPALVGKTAIFRGERKAIYAGYLIRIQAGPNLNPEYLNYALNSPEGRAFSWRVKSDGVSQSNISASKLKGFEFAVPPLPEQREIVRRIESAFDKIDRLAGEAKRALALVGRLDEAVLAKAFRGELVPQAPNDEPASALLERIRAERAATPKPKRGRKAARTD